MPNLVVGPDFIEWRFLEMRDGQRILQFRKNHEVISDGTPYWRDVPLVREVDLEKESPNA